MRGLPASRSIVAIVIFLVPAHAGVTRLRVYWQMVAVPRPRTCGGYPASWTLIESLNASSPHMRGLPALKQGVTPIFGLVPAHAGVTRGLIRAARLRRPRPCTCGGYPVKNVGVGALDNSSPHMRGLPFGAKTLETEFVLVPAHAGVTRPSASRKPPKASRPRTCGGYPVAFPSSSTRTLSSPHMRGLPGEARAFFVACLLVPAHAGVTRPHGQQNLER